MAERKSIQSTCQVLVVMCSVAYAASARAQPNVKITIDPKRPGDESAVNFQFSREDASADDLLYVALTMLESKPGIELDQSQLKSNERDRVYFVGQLQALTNEVQLLAGVKIPQGKNSATVNLDVTGLVTDISKAEDKERTYKIVLTPSTATTQLLPAGFSPAAIKEVTVKLPDRWEPAKNIPAYWAPRGRTMVATVKDEEGHKVKSIEITLIEERNGVQVFLQDHVANFLLILSVTLFTALVVVGVLIEQDIADRRKIRVGLFVLACLVMLLAVAAVGFSRKDIKEIPLKAPHMLAVAVALFIVPCLPPRAQNVMIDAYRRIKVK